MATALSSQRLFCSKCALPWQASQYRMCDRCRDRARVYRSRCRRPAVAVVPPPAHPPRLTASPQSGRRILCSHCARPWSSTRYKTCDSCREKNSKLAAPTIVRSHRQWPTRASLYPPTASYLIDRAMVGAALPGAIFSFPPGLVESMLLLHLPTPLH